MTRSRTAIDPRYCFAISAGLCLVAGVICLHFTLNWPRAEDLQFIDKLRIAQQGFWPWLSVTSSQNVDHPVGLQMLIVTALWSVTGISFTAISVMNFAILTAATLLLLWVTADEVEGWRLPAAAILLPLAAFHPSQMNHLLWPYEMGWFLITLVLVFNAVAIERFRWPALWMTLGCAIASYASAHGRLLWLVAALHLVAAKPARWRVLSAAAFVVIFCGFAVTTHQDTARSSLLTFIGYALDMPGALFGVREPAWLPFWSALLLAPVIALLASARNTPATRISGTLLFASALFVAAFAFGRAAHGLPWVLDRIHIAPMLVPALMGAIVLATKALPRWIGAALCAVVLLSVATALPYALQRARTVVQLETAGRSFVCAGDRSTRLTDFFETGPDIEIIRRNANTLVVLCP